MKKFLIILGIIVGFTVILGILFLCKQEDSRSNDNAQEDTEGRYLTIINETGAIINEVHVYVGNGTEIESMNQINPDATSFSIKIPKSYGSETVFTAELIDRYGFLYSRTVENVSEKGRTEVTIGEGDYVKQDGDLRRKIDRFFNHD